MTLVEKISQAEDALHELSLGRRAVEITRDGRTVKYTATNRVDLELYIARLKSQVTSTSRRPMGISL